MSNLIKKPNELKVPSSIKVLVYGQPGIGKSTIGLSAPSPVMLDFDGGVHRVKQKHLKDTVQVESWQDMIDFMNTDLSAYRTIVIDTAGKMLDYMSQYIIKNEPKMGRKDGALSLQGYGTRKSMFNSLLANISTMGKNLIFVAHEREEKDGDKKVIRPEIGGSSGNDLIKDLDLVGYMEADNKVRTISFDPCEKFYGKNTCQLDSVIRLPDLDKANNDFFSSVFSKFQSSLETRKELGVKYSDLIEEISDAINSIIDLETANQTLEHISKIEHIWDSKLQAGQALNKKCHELGFKFNLKSKQYIDEKEVVNV